MNDLNNILLEGNLTRDPEGKTLNTGVFLCSFPVASNRFYKQNDVFEKETSFFDVEAWAKLGQRCADNLKKGRGVRVVGRLKQERWTDPDGKTKSKVKVVAEHVEFKPEYKRDGQHEGTTATPVVVQNIDDSFTDDIPF